MIQERQKGRRIRSGAIRVKSTCAKEVADDSAKLKSSRPAARAQQKVADRGLKVTDR